MSNSANKSGRPKKGASPFTSIFRNLITGLNQQEAADKIGVARQNIGRWISGETTPDIDTLGKIATAFDVSTDYLLGRTPNKTTDTELKAVCEYTRLSENTILKLRNYGYISETQNIALQTAKLLNQEKVAGNTPDVKKAALDLFSKGYVDVDPSRLMDCVIFEYDNKNVSLLTASEVIDYIVSSDSFGVLVNALSEMIVETCNNALDEENREFKTWKIHQILYDISTNIIQTIQNETCRSADKNKADERNGESNG